jgi:hypothetical protein
MLVSATSCSTSQNKASRTTILVSSHTDSQTSMRSMPGSKISTQIHNKLQLWATTNSPTGANKNSKQFSYPRSPYKRLNSLLPSCSLSLRQLNAPAEASAVTACVTITALVRQTIRLTGATLRKTCRQSTLSAPLSTKANAAPAGLSLMPLLWSPCTF